MPDFHRFESYRAESEGGSVLPEENRLIMQMVEDERRRTEHSPTHIFAVKATTPTDYYAYCSKCALRGGEGSWRKAVMFGLRHNRDVHNFKGLGVRARGLDE